MQESNINHSDSQTPVLLARHEGYYALSGDRGTLNSSTWTYQIGDESVTLTARDSLPLWLAMRGYGAETLAALSYKHEVGYPNWQWLAVAQKMRAQGELATELYEQFAKDYPRG